MVLQEQEGQVFFLASIAKRLAKRSRTDTTYATSTRARTKTDKVGKNGLWKKKEYLSTMNDMWGQLKQY